MRTNFVVGLIAFILTVAAQTGRPQSVLYDNGPAFIKLPLYLDTASYTVADSFTLTTNATITGANFGIAVNSGATLVSVIWLINSSAIGGISYEGDITSPVGTYLQTRGTNDIYSENISIPGLTLSAGTYWFQLQNAVTSDGGKAGWVHSSSPNALTSAVENGVAVPYTEAFQITGELLPEPSSYALTALGGASLLFFRSRKLTSKPSPINQA